VLKICPGKEDVKRIEAFEVWIWRRRERMSWTEMNKKRQRKTEEEEQKVWNTSTKRMKKY